MQNSTPSSVLRGVLVAAATACVPTFDHYTRGWHATEVRTVRNADRLAGAGSDGSLEPRACQSLCAVRSSVTHIEGCSLATMELRGDHLLCFHSDDGGRASHRSHLPIPSELSGADETTRVAFSDCARFCGSKNATCRVERATAPPPGENFVLCHYRIEGHRVDSRF
ncbi:MAG TPA: hypothetical protein VFZ53_18450 [Polyangiaceae bacterium]